MSGPWGQRAVMMQMKLLRGVAAAWCRERPVGPYVLWLALWAGLNSGPDGLANATTSWGAIHGLRAFLPLMAGCLALSMWLMNGAPIRASLSATGLLTLYGIVGVATSVVCSPSPATGFYWACAFLAVFAVLSVWRAETNSTQSLWRLMRLNWVIVAILGIGLSLISIVGVVRAGETSFYSVLIHVPTISGMPMVRPTGTGRYVALLGILALSRTLYGQGFARCVGWGLVLIWSCVSLWLSQSVGSMIGFVVAAGLLVMLRSPRVGVAICATVAIVLLAPNGLLWKLGSPVSLLSGRQYIWGAALDFVRDSPALGWGFHADRMLLEGPYRSHVSNAFLHALLQAGLVGVVPFVSAWLWAWGHAFRLSVLGGRGPVERAAICEPLGLLAFLSVRAIFESTGAFFGGDLLLLAPIFACLEARPVPAVAVSDTPVIRDSRRQLAAVS